MMEGSDGHPTNVVQRPSHNTSSQRNCPETLMSPVPLRHDSESQQLYGERQKQLHAYGLGKPQKGKWGTRAQLMERRSIFGDPSRVGCGLRAGRMLRRSRAYFLKLRQWLYVELGTVLKPEPGRWIPCAYSQTASSMTLANLSLPCHPWPSILWAQSALLPSEGEAMSSLLCPPQLLQSAMG